MKTKFGTAGLDNNGYYRINSGKEGNNNKVLHRLIWEDHYGKSVPKGYVIHHINHDKTDNRIQNLQCVKDENHKRYHSSNPTDETRQKLSETKKGWKNPNYGKKLSPERRKQLLEYVKKPCTETHRQNLSKSRNKTGYFNVSKHHNKKYKQGFIWRYLYLQDGKRHEIQRVNIVDLEREVKKRGLKWLKFEED